MNTYTIIQSLAQQYTATAENKILRKWKDYEYCISKFSIIFCYQWWWHLYTARHSPWECMFICEYVYLSTHTYLEKRKYKNKQIQIPKQLMYMCFCLWYNIHIHSYIFIFMHNETRQEILHVILRLFSRFYILSFIFLAWSNFCVLLCGIKNKNVKFKHSRPQIFECITDAHNNATKLTLSVCRF